jgi:hypothetical protein
MQNNPAGVKESGIEDRRFDALDEIVAEHEPSIVRRILLRCKQNTRRAAGVVFQSAATDDLF